MERPTAQGRAVLVGDAEAGLLHRFGPALRRRRRGLPAVQGAGRPHHEAHRLVVHRVQPHKSTRGRDSRILLSPLVVLVESTPLIMLVESIPAIHEHFLLNM